MSTGDSSLPALRSPDLLAFVQDLQVAMLTDAQRLRDDPGVQRRFFEKAASLGTLGDRLLAQLLVRMATRALAAAGIDGPHQRGAGGHPAVEQALALIAEQYPQQLTLRDVARSVGREPTYFAVLFKKHVGMTFRGYLNHLRATKAAALVEQGTKREAAALLVGFRSRSSLYRHLSRARSNGH
jgi:transcriptional regulator GlxA family with amidase domain